MDELEFKFSKPFVFEGETFDSLDLSGLEDLTTADMMAAEKYTRKKDPQIMAMYEMTLPYTQFIAYRASDKPLEFFERLPAREMIKLKNRITGFIYGAGSGESTPNPSDAPV